LKCDHKIYLIPRINIDSRLNETSGFISDGIGNYSLDVKCSWLIEAGNSTNSTIRLHFEEFITECGWDHLYIYDGDSVHSPLLGVYRYLLSLNYDKTILNYDKK